MGGDVVCCLAWSAHMFKYREQKRGKENTFVRAQLYAPVAKCSTSTITKVWCESVKCKVAKIFLCRDIKDLTALLSLGPRF
jgi:hypothetical protein